MGWNKFSFIAAGLLAASLLLGGRGGSAQEAGSAFTQDILKSYPELKDHKPTVTVVKRVVDGDTFETKEGDKVRLIGVNTPETVKPNSPVEKYGKEASNFTKSKLTGKKVILYADAGDKDKYGRSLRYVFIEGDPVMFNEVLVREGYANTMTIQPNVLFQKKFLQLEREARNKKKGLWADDAGK
ncbi:thermonuclease family protein [Paenibacillus sp. P26]|nr:thermonuclease family protein [Paenibacillus sp. P26]